MKRFPTGAAWPTFLAIFVPFAACIPSPDVAGLPPYDAGGIPSEDTGIFFTEDSGGTTGSEDAGAGEGGGLVDGAVAVGTINGVVIDYTQANGRGVVPGASVRVTTLSGSGASAPPAVTSDANGLFTIPNAPAGVSLEITVTKPTDLTNAIAYSTSLLVATVNAGQTLSVFPVIHEGCFQTYPLGPAVDAGSQLPVTVTLQSAQCGGANPREGAYAAMTFEATSFVDLATSSPWTQSIRVEMIPLAYPLTGGTTEVGPPDLSWSLGLPGAVTPSGLIGAAEYRVVKSDPGQTDDGEPLALSGSANSSVAIAVPLYTTPTTETPLTYSYDPATGGWSSETVTLGATGLSQGGIRYQMMTVPHLTWWGLANGPVSSTCVTGTLQGATGSILVRAAGATYLGASTTTTNTTGSFCLDVSAGAAGQIELSAGAIVGAIPSAATQNYEVTVDAGTGSCASGTGCLALGGIPLLPILSCVSGTASLQTGGVVPSPLSVFENFSNVTSAAQSAGIEPTAYLGQVTPGTNGSFCALGEPGGTVSLGAGNQPLACPYGGSIFVPGGSNAPVCSAGGCVDAGAVTLGCD